MYFRQLKGSDYHANNRANLFIIWKDVNEDEDSTSGGQDILDEYADWDFTTNKNKLSFKLRLIY